MSGLAGRAALFHNGGIRFRNISSSGYPFRPSSHVLYFAGRYPPGAIALIGDGVSEVYLRKPGLDEVVWDGPGRSWKDYEDEFGVTVRDRAGLEARLTAFGVERVLALPTFDPEANAEVARLLGREADLAGPDQELALAVVEARIEQDALALTETRAAVGATVESYLAAMRATKPGASGFEIVSALEFEGARRGFLPSFAPICTVEAEVIHSVEIPPALPAESMLLVDFGLESRFGFCSDVTRTWPVRGKFSPEQRDVYELVLEVQKWAVAAARPGALFGEIHLGACRKVAEGLAALGILRGDPDSLVKRGAHSLFFPHGLGHLLGADVHDMEDLGDLAGYADGQTRDERFGFKFLRLNRKLRERMLVTIEPGIYFIPAVLDSPAFTERFRDCIDRDRLELFRPVRGVRIEDDVLVGREANEVLTAEIPKSIEALERAVGK